MKPVRLLPKRIHLALWISLISVQYGEGGRHRQVELAGTTVFLHSANKANKTIPSIRWKKSDTLIGNLRKANKSSYLCCQFQPSSVCRCIIFPNGSLRLDYAAKNDNGNYTVELHDDVGKDIGSVDVELLVQDGNYMMTCSVPDSEGVELFWMDSSNRTWNAEHALSLASHTPGWIVCVAQNELSRLSSQPVSPQCRGRISLLVALGMFLCVLAFSMTIMIRRNRIRKDENEDVEENPYVTMHGLVGKKKKDGRKESVEMDTSVYVTCRTYCVRDTEDGNEGNM
ncbi:uncharacterized protein LOC108923037 isoform X2 [Scleropages formosus]|uniref:uncharacterized protein LOC108923037 isoform X2 n=1 Tax=Scleropages formosus TaxID=113540 RepID=UPI000878AB5F|nr:uncharacterized protein LOC108923037 isoform X2 [Scleropages formosus]